MNYGKKNAAKIKWQLTSRGTVMRRKVKSLTLLIILLCFVLVLGYGGYRGYPVSYTHLTLPTTERV